MLHQRKKQIVKYILYVLILFLLYILQTTPYFLVVFQGKPVWIAAAVVAISMLEHEVTAAIFGVFAGMLWDLSSSMLFGFHALVLLIGAVAISLLVMHLMRVKLLNALMFTAVIMLAERLLYYFFCYLIWNRDPTGRLMLTSLLPTWGLTILVTIPVYFLYRAVALWLDDTVRT